MFLFGGRPYIVASRQKKTLKKNRKKTGKHGEKKKRGRVWRVWRVSAGRGPLLILIVILYVLLSHIQYHSIVGFFYGVALSWPSPALPTDTKNKNGNPSLACFLVRMHFFTVACLIVVQTYETMSSVLLQPRRYLSIVPGFSMILIS